MATLIKRYANRKLYNTDTSRYITLRGIADLLDAGEEVRVIDNETGEDITSVALSQILVDSKRSNTSPPETLLSQIFGRGSDALYGALRRGVDDATGGIGEIQERVRRMVGVDDDGADERASEGSGQGNGQESGEGGAERRDARSEQRKRSARGEPHHERHGIGNWINHASPDLERLVQNAVERVFKLLDLPRRSDIDALNRNLERVASAVETLERAFDQRKSSRDSGEATPDR